jgi:ATP-dependent Clp protease adapter protein ClpS
MTCFNFTTAVINNATIPAGINPVTSNATHRMEAPAHEWVIAYQRTIQIMRALHHNGLCIVCLAQQTTKLIQKSRIFAGASPSVRRLALGKIRQLGRLFTIVEKLVHGNFQSPRHLLQCFNGGNSVVVFNTADIAPNQAHALFDIALREFLVFAECAKSVAYNYGGIIPLGSK